MEPLARDGLSAQRVTDLLHTPHLTVSAGLDLLDVDLTWVADISDDLVSGSVARNLNATIHGTCSLRITRELRWGVDLVRPFMVLSDGAVSVRFNTGVYCPTTPDRVIGETPETWEVQGADRLHLLNEPVGAEYTVAAGTTYRAAAEAVFAAADLTGYLIEGAAADATLPTGKTWLLVGIDQADPDQTTTPVTWLRILNDLQRQWNGRAVYCDAEGRFRLEAYREPSTRAPDFTFDADTSETIVGEQRRIVGDVWAIPNRWIFRWTNAPEGTATADLSYAVDNLADGITSQSVRGRIKRAVIDYEAASRSALVALGDARVARDLRSMTRYELPIGPFPCAGHADVYQYRDAAAGVDRKVQQISFDLDLLGADTRMTWEAV